MTPISRGKAFGRAFFAKYPVAKHIMGIFDHLPDVCFFAKDTKSRIVHANARFLEHHGGVSLETLLGQCDRDFHTPLHAEAYIAEDQRVMSSGQPAEGQVWLVPNARGVPNWYVCSKVPIFDERGQVIGLVGAMYRIETPGDTSHHFRELTPVIRHLEARFAEPLRMSDLAALAGISLTHFNRRFVQIFRITPKQFILSLRIQAAQRLLNTTARPVSEIASATGFCDQAHFTKRFSTETGMTPLAYRKRFRHA
ncbi:MAG: helix-turn-helix domain-containing protein [Planctomycetes bacterium]|nr:helix-turn-helix domain-containing protein [Planctomycetota bacterium]